MRLGIGPSGGAADSTAGDSGAGDSGAGDSGAAEKSATGSGALDSSGATASSTADSRTADSPPADSRAADSRAADSRAAESGASSVTDSGAAGTLFARITLLPPLLLMAWLLAGLPLLLAGRFSAGLVSFTAAVVAVALTVPVLAVAPLRWPHRRTPWWTLATVIAIAVGFGVWQGLMHSEQVIVRRDPATYLQFAYWIATHGSLPVPQLRSAFGGEIPGLGFQSLGFYAHGTALVPQFMAGPPMVLAPALWIKGVQLAVFAAPVFGAGAVLTFGGLVGRLCGPRWAPLGALVLALSLPEVYTSRASFSEPLAQILLFGGLCLAADALWPTIARRRVVASGRRAPWVLAAVGGLAFGLSILVRIDGISEILPVILFCGILYATRRGGAWPMACGLAVGAGYGLLDGYVLSRPYLSSLSSELRLLGYAAAAFAAVTIVVVAISRRGPLQPLATGRWRWVPDVTALAVVAVMVAFAVRPLVQRVRGETNPTTVAFIAEVQKLAHLPIDPHRTYAEDSLYWVIWYIGVPAVLLATFGAALLARRFLRGAAPIWGLSVMVIGWSVITTLWRPGIVPDQPWASRRLAPMVLPGLVLFAVWSCGWLVGRARARGAGRIAQGAAASCCAVALLLPTAVTTFGIGVARTADGRVRLSANGLASKRTDTAEIGVVNSVCRAIGRDASVLIIDPLTADRFTQVVRGMCGVPAARLDSPTPAAVAMVMSGIQRAGRRPVLLAGEAAQLAPYGGITRRIVYRATRQDEHRLTQPPTTTWRILYQIWMSTPTA